MTWEPEYNREALNWTWKNECRVCDDCNWFVMAEKFYYWCIGCEKTVDKHPWFDNVGSEE